MFLLRRRPAWCQEPPRQSAPATGSRCRAPPRSRSLIEGWPGSPPPRRTAGAGEQPHITRGERPFEAFDTCPGGARRARREAPRRCPGRCRSRSAGSPGRAGSCPDRATRPRWRAVRARPRAGARVVEDEVRERVREVARDRHQPVVRPAPDRSRPDSSRRSGPSRAARWARAGEHRREEAGPRLLEELVLAASPAHAACSRGMAADEARRSETDSQRPLFVDPTSVTVAPTGRERRRDLILQALRGRSRRSPSSALEAAGRERLGRLVHCATHSPPAPSDSPSASQPTTVLGSLPFRGQADGNPISPVPIASRT